MHASDGRAKSEVPAVQISANAPINPLLYLQPQPTPAAVAPVQAIQPVQQQDPAATISLRHNTSSNADNGQQHHTSSQSNGTTPHQAKPISGALVDYYA
jgi:hypothetical protein